MDNLPVELLSYIVKFLGLADRREFALASKKCYESTLDPALHRNSTYKVDAHVLIPEPGESVSGDGLSFYCKSPNLYIYGLEENINVKSLLHLEDGSNSILGPHVLKLSLKGSSILERSFVEILKRCESLESLDITGCNSLFMTTFLIQKDRKEIAGNVLRETEELKLSSIRYLDDASFSRLVGMCPNLSSLSIASSNMLFSDFASSRQGFTFSAFRKFVMDRASLLTKLDLSRTSISNSALKQLVDVKGLKLHEIVLQNCRELGDAGVVEMAKKQTTLRVCDLHGCCEIGNPSVAALCSCASNLRELNVSKCRKVTDSSAIKIPLLDKLEVLDISECYEITMKTIYDILILNQNLTTLKANGCNFCKLETMMGQVEMVSDKKDFSTDKNMILQRKTMSSIPTEIRTHLYDNLTSLSINSGKYVNDLTVQAVFVHLTKLECLSLAWCHHVTDRGLLGVEINMNEQPSYPNVDIATADFLSTGRYSTSHGRSGFLSLPGSEYAYVEIDPVELKGSLDKRGITRLQCLRRLSLSNCPNISDESLLRIFCAGQTPFPKMEHLELNMLPKAVKDDLLNGISHGCPLLTKLSISCSLVTDVSVQYIASRLHRLEVLNCSNCDYITAKYFPLLAKNARWLRELDLSACQGISRNSAHRLQKSMPVLTKVQTRYSGSMVPA